MRWSACFATYRPSVSDGSSPNWRWYSAANPGVILKAEVDFVSPAIGEGQLQPGADFMRFNQQTSPGRDAVALRITDPAYEQYKLPGGRFGQAAVYTEHFHHVGILRKVLLRMSAWMNYVFPLH